MYDPLNDLDAIEGIISELTSRTDRPQGYPFSKIIIYTVCPELKLWAKYMHLANIHIISADQVPSMKKLDFKKAGKEFPEKVKEWKNDLSLVPQKYLITASRFDATDQPKRKTTGCKKYLIEVETGDCSEHWETIQFRKAVKKHVTEDLDIHITPPIWGDKYPELNRDDICARINCTLLNCSESLYQSLEKWGEWEFSQLPIKLRILTRKEFYHGLNINGREYDLGIAKVVISMRGDEGYFNEACRRIKQAYDQSDMFI